MELGALLSSIFLLHLLLYSKIHESDDNYITLNNVVADTRLPLFTK